MLHRNQNIGRVLTIATSLLLASACSSSEPVETDRVLTAEELAAESEAETAAARQWVADYAFDEELSPPAFKAVDPSLDQDMLEPPTLVYVLCQDTGSSDFCDPSCPCAIGEGDCDRDADCAGDAVCVQRAGTDFCEAAGTSGCAESAGNHASAPGAVEFCVPDCTCTYGEGDCDTDTDCMPGLTCFQQAGDDFCGILCADGSGVHMVAPDSDDFCSAGCPCAAGEGDCDSDAECVTGTLCDFQPGPDRCVAENACAEGGIHTSTQGSGDYCSAACTCNAGEADCDRDTDCAAGLTCIHNQGGDVGLPAVFDYCN